MKIAVFFRYQVKYVLIILLLLGGNNLTAQCPVNIDFELGNWTGWQIFYQDGYTGGIPNPINPTPPIAGRHDFYSNPPGNGRDLYGNFPKNCPNGSGNSIRIGYEPAGQRADKVSFTFTIPLGQNTFSLIYNYAIVLNDGGNNHNSSNQPSFRIEARNITDGLPLPCPMDPIIVGGTLPGFTLSPIPHNGPVWYKPWAAASINLDNLDGKTIELSFIASGCGLNGGSHFGYAYIDVNTECSSSFIGATFCPDDAFINVTAPYGYDDYTWYDDILLTNQIGTGQTINFTPPPPAGTVIYVKMDPYPGYGCTNVLAAELLDTLTLQAQAGPDMLSCQNAPVQLGVNSRPGYVYSWSPITGLNDPNISNPIATPSVTTQYILTVTTAGGGCLNTDTVIVNAAVLDNNMVITGPTSGCILVPQPTTLQVAPADSVQWYLNGVAIPGATQPLYNVTQGGTYHATVFSFVGCNLSTTPVLIDLKAAPIVGFNINNLDQCFTNNQFIYTNTSSVATGTLQYDWNLGDGNTATTTDVTHSYAQPGTYIVRLIVTTDQGCIDSISFTVNVFENPVAGFTANTTQQCLGQNSFVFTNTSVLNTGTAQYTWTMGDGNIFTTRDVAHGYAVPGMYTVKLLVTSDKGCADSTTFDVTVNPGPVAGFSTASPQQCFDNNQFDFINSTTLSSGTLQYAWDLGDGTTATTRDVTHSYTQPGDYIVKMVATSDGGCADSTIMNIKIFGIANADFYVSPVCINLRVPLTNKTINSTGNPLNYLWDFGNGQTSSEINPVYSYPAPGSFTIKLSVSTAQCPTTYSVKQASLYIDAPAPNTRYADKEVVMNFELPLEARSIGNSVLWSPPTSLDRPASYKPVFKGLDPQLYHITLKTLSGCVTVDTQYVKTRKKIEIYVPTSFTPNGDGRNDYLRPYTLSFKSVTHFRVFNRWGKLLFQMQSDTPGWDGRTNGQYQETQTVVWEIEAIDVDGKVHKKKGTSVLLH